MQAIVQRRRYIVAALVAVTALLLAVMQPWQFGEATAQDRGRSGGQGQGAPPSGNVAPHFEVDPFWPKPLPNDWILGQVAGIDVDAQGHIWLVQRPGSLDDSERGLELGRSDCCLPAPPVMQFDADGNVLQAWGGPGEGFDWPENEHGLFVDDDGFVWIAGNGSDDHQVLKFTASGEFVMQIGEAGVTGGDGDTEHLGRPADMSVDTEAREVYIADGYSNHRVIVFDSDTGEFKRMWGADGVDPTSPDNDFGNPVHCAVLTDDGLVYVCDRPNNRVQVFERDGTFVREFEIAPETGGLGTTWDVEPSADRGQTFLYDADGENNHIWVLLRETDEVLGSFGRHGRYAGQFHWVHNVAVDQRGNLYTAEVDTGKRAQKFVFRGYRPAGR